MRLHLDPFPAGRSRVPSDTVYGSRRCGRDTTPKRKVHFP